MTGLLMVLSLAPFGIFLILLLGKKTSLLTAAVSTLVVMTILGLAYWRILPEYVLVSLIKGTLVAVDILIIILGAIFFLEILTKVGVIENICFFLESFYKDIRVQVIILAWFLENFIEGTAGFGTPSIVVAPLLVGLGLSPITAVVISLLGNSTSVAFGAAGTPIRVGMAGLNVIGVPEYTVLLNSVGVLVPVFMLGVLALKQKGGKAFFGEGLPFALWCGVAFAVPSILIIPLGQEFPSILGSILGLALVLVTSRWGIFMPKNIRSVREEKKPEIQLPAAKVVLPYAFLIVLLIAGKWLIGPASIGWESWGTKYSISLYNPGWAFIIATLPTIFWERRRGLVSSSITVAIKRTIEPFLVIVAMSTMVQLMLNSGHNLSGIPSALEFLASNLKSRALPFLAPIMGAFGSFITGSATVSNIMFGNLLSTAGSAVNLNVAKILALELVGAAAGNMIALADMLAAEAIVGLRNQERQILKGVIIHCIIYVVLVGILGMIVI